MLNKIVLKNICRVTLIVICALALSGCEAIRTMDSFDGILEKGASSEPEAVTLTQAESAFFNGNYTLAKNLFTKVSHESEKPHYKNQAYYGLVCISIVTAEGMADLKKAIAMMAKWQKPETDINGYLENPQMMSFALSKKTELFNCENEIKVISANKKTIVSQEQQQEIEQLKNTIKKLEHQISVLEAIDQEIQEKRKPI